MNRKLGSFVRIDKTGKVEATGTVWPNEADIGSVGENRRIPEESGTACGQGMTAFAVVISCLQEKAH